MLPWKGGSRPLGSATWQFIDLYRENGAGDGIRTHDFNLGKVKAMGFLMFSGVTHEITTLYQSIVFNV